MRFPIAAPAVSRCPRAANSTRAAFTLVELMIVVVVLGVLAAVSIPAFSRYVMRSKTAEATCNISMIAQSEIAYYWQVSAGSAPSFATAPLTPTAAPGAGKYPAQPSTFTTNPAWSALGFSLEYPFYYAYSASGSATGFTATANGDLDGDGILSTFSRSATILSGEIQNDPVVIVDELE